MNSKVLRLSSLIVLGIGLGIGLQTPESSGVRASTCINPFSTNPTRNLEADIEQAEQMGYDCIRLATGTYTTAVDLGGLADMTIQPAIGASVTISAPFEIADAIDVSVIDIEFTDIVRFTKANVLEIINTTHRKTLFLNDLGNETNRSTYVYLNGVEVIPNGYLGTNFLGIMVGYTNDFTCIDCVVERAPLVIDNSRIIEVIGGSFTDSDQWGIFIRKSTNFLVVVDSASRNADGLRIEASNIGEVRDGIFNQNCYEGIDIDSSDNIYVNGVQANNNNDAGIGISDLTSRCVSPPGEYGDCPVTVVPDNLICSHLPEGIVIKNNFTFFNNSAGIGSDGANGIYVEGNHIYANGLLDPPMGAVGWIDPEDRCLRRDVRLLDPEWTGAGKMGIYMQHVKGVDLRGNTVDTHCVGIAVQECQGVIVYNNTVTNYDHAYVNFNNIAPVTFIPTVPATAHRNCLSCSEEMGGPGGGIMVQRTAPECSQHQDACACNYVPATVVSPLAVSPTPTGTRSHPLVTSTPVPGFTPSTCTPIPTATP